MKIALHALSLSTASVTIAPCTYKKAQMESAFNTIAKHSVCSLYYAKLLLSSGKAGVSHCYYLELE